MEKQNTSGFRNAQAARSCRLPTGRRTTLRRLITNCFGTGREHKLNHRWRLSRARDCKWMSGPAGTQGPPAERHSCAAKDSRSMQRALSGARPENSCFSL